MKGDHMLLVTFYPQRAVAVLEPHGRLTRRDFEEAASIIDPFIEGADRIKGLVIKAQHFPGWDSFGALVEHMKFIWDHHEQIGRVAMVTDSPLGAVAEALGGHFVDAEIREFPYTDLSAAMQWISETGP
ncbi:MAG: STAS/SEC14 domain-containing protein [Proteobacteria bacterium]|jgi:hypothetical protein|nr:STAS/SEC14 domain-containing protein [Pseudomonadota bacterium]MDA1300539.1 STAS/SEC14 domain-containing protein [Pseudomonadota bacterium]